MTATRAIRIHQFGGPERMQFEEVELPPLVRGEVRVRHTAIGVNFIDIYERTGLYPLPLPSVLGREAAGTIEELGPGVRNVAVGDRVAYVNERAGAYAEHCNVPARRLVRLPVEVSDETAAAVMLKGLTAYMLLRQAYRVTRVDTLLVHAAAGGVGLLLLQWARLLGARVIALVGSPAKADVARAHGADQVLLTSDDWPDAVKELTAGAGVSVVYDSVGRHTFASSLGCLRKRGLMVSFGNASGPVEPIAPLELARRGSLFLTRPVLFDYIGKRGELAKGAEELLCLIARSALVVHIGGRHGLSAAADAHRELESRNTTGSTVLLP